MRASVMPAIPKPSMSANPVVQASEARKSSSALVIRCLSRAKFSVIMRSTSLARTTVCSRRRSLSPRSARRRVLSRKSQIQKDPRRIQVAFDFKAEAFQCGFLLNALSRCR